MKVILNQIKNMNVLFEEVNTLESNAAICKNVSNKLEAGNQRLKNDISELKLRIDDNEQRNRNFCLLLHGVVESPDEKTDDKILEIINHDIGVHISIDDIERSRRLGARNTHRMLRSTQERPRPIIFRFSSFRKRMEVFKNKRNLKGKSISLSENLTKDRYILYQKAIQRIGKGKVWTSEGRVTTKLGNKYLTINALKDIDNILTTS